MTPEQVNTNQMQLQERQRALLDGEHILLDTVNRNLIQARERELALLGCS